MDNPRLQTVLRKVKERASNKSELKDCHIHVCSENNFPTAAGLASSAAGYACLVSALTKLFNVQGNVTDIARLGSGSACRSLDGGFVEWTMGEKDSGEDSTGKQIVTEDHWPEMRIIILVVSGKKKAIGSSKGMLRSTQTSPFLKHRADKVVPDNMKKMQAAIKSKDFPAFAEVTMKESNQLHSVCQDTYPPISYMNDTSWSIVRLVHAYNEYKGQIKVAYTFDAGPNAVLYLLKESVSEVLAFINHVFPPPNNQEKHLYFKGLPSESNHEVTKATLNSVLSMEPQQNAVKYIIHTKVGPGAQEITNEAASLLDENGLPKL
ncbi:putative diphosphomevalonate decarboxylase-like [Apostichopus japonicus]|uniref:Diphosphomevalonate decarboxylase n=1 Tax=Stichopus japonicus TaxID=307972 RepID=A0A2G8K954_STIJA|nr:putative diphosphomevalonate decarboxylase-like [Apostichopus japonicus]